MDGKIEDKVRKVNDLGFLIYEELKFHVHMSMAISKANYIGHCEKDI